VTPEKNFPDHKSTFSLSFSSFYRLFSAKANFFAKKILLLKFFLFHLGETNQFLCPLGTVLFFVPQVELCSPLGEFLSFGPILIKILQRDNKAQPSGQKKNILPSFGTPFRLEKKKKIEQQKKKKKKKKKKKMQKIGLGRKKSVKRWKSGFVVRKFYLGGSFLFHRHKFLLKNHFIEQ